MSLSPSSLSEHEMEMEESPPAPTPEQRLMAAVVRRAVFDFVFYREVDPVESPKRHSLARDAAGWLFWDGEELVDEQGRVTFLHVCDILGIEPVRVRRGALRLTRDDIKKLHNSFKES